MQDICIDSSGSDDVAVHGQFDKVRNAEGVVAAERWDRAKCSCETLSHKGDEVDGNIGHRRDLAGQRAVVICDEDTRNGEVLAIRDAASIRSGCG